jgi:hypothetical protein
VRRLRDKGGHRFGSAVFSSRFRRLFSLSGALSSLRAYVDTQVHLVFAGGSGVPKVVIRPEAMRRHLVGVRLARGVLKRIIKIRDRRVGSAAVGARREMSQKQESLQNAESTD